MRVYRFIRAHNVALFLCFVVSRAYRVLWPDAVRAGGGRCRRILRRSCGSARFGWNLFRMLGLACVGVLRLSGFGGLNSAWVGRQVVITENPIVSWRSAQVAGDFSSAYVLKQVWSGSPRFFALFAVFGVGA